jgi:hypothetical protein
MKITGSFVRTLSNVGEGPAADRWIVPALVDKENSMKRNMPQVVHDKFSEQVLNMSLAERKVFIVYPAWTAVGGSGIGSWKSSCDQWLSRKNCRSNETGLVTVFRPLTTTGPGETAVQLGAARSVVEYRV